MTPRRIRWFLSLQDVLLTTTAHIASWRSRSWLHLHCRVGINHACSLAWIHTFLSFPLLLVYPKELKVHLHELLHYYSLIHYFISRTHEMKWNEMKAWWPSVKWNEMKWSSHCFSRKACEMKLNEMLVFHEISLEFHEKKKDPLMKSKPWKGRKNVTQKLWGVGKAGATCK